MNSENRSVLVTGAGRGIGRAAAERFADAGWTVYAGVRTAESRVESFAAGGQIVPVQLDVRRDVDIAALVDLLPAHLNAVVNNAGIVVEGPVEAILPDQLREVFEVNVTGAVAVTQAVLPIVRAANGRVVFVSSMSGRVTTPWTGAYCASKAALESIADALRMELRAWRIPVSLIEPNVTATDIWAGADAMVDASVEQMTPELRDLYASHIDGVRRGVSKLQRMAGPVDAVVDAIEHAVTAHRPRSRYPIGLSSLLMEASSAVTPTPVLDRVLTAAMGFPKGGRR